MKRTIAFSVAALVAGFTFLAGRPAFADEADCDTLDPAVVFNAGECQLSVGLTKSGIKSVGHTLHILAGGSITVPLLAGGNSLTLNITGGLIMDAGTQITGDVTGTGAIGATIIVDVTGNIHLNGGVTISSNQSASSCTTGKAGNVRLEADGDITLDAGAVIRVNGSPCPAGEIILLAGVDANGGNVSMDGLVESFSTMPGTTQANQRPGGGPITIEAGCDLTISDTGIVSSRGKDAGADLVHLAGSCAVKIFGLVESTAIPGQGVPHNPPNRCNNVTRPDKPTNSTACVEVWAGDSLTIDSILPHAGEVNADTGGMGGSGGTSWIDLFARGPITINGDVSGNFAVHANGLAGTNDNGGDITVKSKGGAVTMGGPPSARALQANATGNGGKGGNVVVQAGGLATVGAVNFGSALVEALGADAGGGGQQGGSISSRSFNDMVLGSAPGALDTREGPTTPNGSITFQACSGVAYTGTTDAASVTTLPAACGGQPTFKPYVTLPNCKCVELCQPFPPGCICFPI